MNILFVRWDVIMLWKLLSGTARLYAALLLILGSYAIYSLARVFVGLGNLREKPSLDARRTPRSEHPSNCTVAAPSVWDNRRERGLRCVLQSSGRAIVPR
jgi:hypothetical protein